MKPVFILVAMLLAGPAHAALNLSCDLWNRSGDHNSSVNMILADVIGSTPDNHQVSPSVVHMIDKLNNTVIIADEISHLNLVDANGLFKKVKKKFYPLKPGGDPLKPEPVIQEVRQLDVEMKLKASEKLRALSFSIDQGMGPYDTTFTGTGTVQIGTKKYEDVTFNCGVYIEWGSYKRMADKAKGVK